MWYMLSTAKFLTYTIQYREQLNEILSSTSLLVFANKHISTEAALIDLNSCRTEIQ